MTLRSLYFKPAEWSCRCGCGLEPQQALLDRLDRLRAAFGAPIEVTCMARCKTHNAAIGGRPGSQHLIGAAADLVSTPALAAFLEANLQAFDIYMEAPSSTPTWRHVQLMPPPSGRRIFWP